MIKILFIMDNYSQLVERIARSAGVPREDIERRVEAKRAKLSGLISKEGACQIIAAELGIVFDNEVLKISELVDGMKRARIIGQVTKIMPVRSFNKNGREGKVANIFVGDESSNVRVVLWDTHHIELVENNKLKEGDVVEVSNASMRNGEMHLNAFSDIKLSKEKINDVKINRVAVNGRLKDAKPGAYTNIRGVIVQMFDPAYFDDKRNEGQKRALVNAILDDGTETIRAVFGIEQLENLGFTKDEVFSKEVFQVKKKEFLGEERIFTGNCRMNSYFNKVELSIDKIDSVDADSLIKELEAVTQA